MLGYHTDALALESRCSAGLPTGNTMLRSCAFLQDAAVYGYVPQNFNKNGFSSDSDQEKISVRNAWLTEDGSFVHACIKRESSRDAQETPNKRQRCSKARGRKRDPEVAQTLQKSRRTMAIDRERT